jgi:hypothetical protein
MKASAGDTENEARDEGWDETVLVWNATVARIPAPAAAAGRRESGPPSVRAPDRSSRLRGRRARRPSSAEPDQA